MKKHGILFLSVMISVFLLVTGCAVKDSVDSSSQIQKETSDVVVQNNDKLSSNEKELLVDNLLAEVANDDIKNDSSGDIFQLIENTSLADLSNALIIVNNYCEIENNSTECSKMRKKLRERGDFLKDKRFEEIKNDKEHLAINLYEFQALLRSQQNASGENTWFSKENVEKVNRETKKLMEERFENILRNGNLEDLHNELIWILANTPASCNTSVETKIDPSGFGLYGIKICDYEKRLIDRARAFVANMLSEKDLCNLDNKEKEEVKKLISNCDALIKDADFCNKLKNNDIVGAYNRLLDIMRSDNTRIDCAPNDVSKNETPDTLIRRNYVFGNNDYKFSLVFLESWGSISEEIREGMDNTKIFKEIVLKSENDNERYLIINIVKINDKDDPSISDYPQMYLTENDDFVFYYSGSADNAGMPGMEDQKYFDIQNETMEIIKTFEFIR